MSNLQIFKATHIFFSKNISLYAIFNDQSFNDLLTNDIVSFEQLGPGRQRVWVHNCFPVDQPSSKKRFPLKRTNLLPREHIISI